MFKTIIIALISTLGLTSLANAFELSDASSTIERRDTENVEWGGA